MEEKIPQEEVKEPRHEGFSRSGSGQTDIGGLIAQFEAFLDEYMVKKAPFAIPAGGKEFIVKVSPYLIIIFAILALPLIFAALGLSAVVAPFAMMGGYVWGFRAVISLLVSVIVLAMELMAVSGLFKRTKASWRLIFYASIVSLIGSILALNIVGGIIGAIIGWYILFQVKDMYKN